MRIKIDKQKMLIDIRNILRYLIVLSLVIFSCNESEIYEVEPVDQSTSYIKGCIVDDIDMPSTISTRIESAEDECFKVQIYVYRVIQEGRKQPQSKINSVLQTLYDDFSSLDIEFELVGQSDLQDDSEGEWWAANGHFAGPKYLLFSSNIPYYANAVNIYILPDDYRDPSGEKFSFNGEGRIIGGGLQKVGTYFGGPTNIPGVGTEQGSNMDNHVVTHEMGHCLGLGHLSSDLSNVMHVGSRTLATKNTGPFQIGGIAKFSTEQISKMRQTLLINTVVSGTTLEILNPTFANWLLAPNQGPNNNSWPFVSGDMVNITWDTSKILFSSNVKIELYKNGELEKILNSSTANDGLWVWEIPTSSSLPRGGGMNLFQIRIEDIDNHCTNYDMSNSLFSLLISN